MAFNVINTERAFIIKRKAEKDNVKLPDPNPNMKPEEVMRFYSNQYPELTTSNVIGPEIKNEKAIYSFQTIIGEKG